ncbi:helix-turn-helix transcriptional regulator, partial [Streptococcus uberis]|uniref:helix-turn-helix transcriptional regulator n=2 Tax=Streptococcus uberis TaxID=1349 RepID=UPI003D6B87FE
MRKNWTQDEIEYLEKNYETKSIKLIAKNLDRLYNSVVLKIKSLGLSLKGDENYINIADFCDLTGISRSTIEYWIRNVSFPTR